MNRNLLTILQLYLVIVLLLLAMLNVSIPVLFSTPNFLLKREYFMVSSLHCMGQEDNFISGPWNENGLIEDFYEEEQLAYGDNWN